MLSVVHGISARDTRAIIPKRETIRKRRAFRRSHSGVILCGASAMKKEKISELTTNRLSVYLRCLNELAGAGNKRVSSPEIGEQFKLKSDQNRKELRDFWGFGRRGTGDFFHDLRAHLTKRLWFGKRA